MTKFQREMTTTSGHAPVYTPSTMTSLTQDLLLVQGQPFMSPTSPASNAPTSSNTQRLDEWSSVDVESSVPDEWVVSYRRLDGYGGIEWKTQHFDNEEMAGEYYDTYANIYRDVRMEAVTRVIVRATHGLD